MTMTTDETLTADLILTTLQAREKTIRESIDVTVADIVRYNAENRSVDLIAEALIRQSTELAVYRLIRNMLDRLQHPRVGARQMGQRPMTDSNALVAAVHQTAARTLIETGIRQSNPIDIARHEFERGEWARIYHLTEPAEETR